MAAGVSRQPAGFASPSRDHTCGPAPADSKQGPQAGRGGAGVRGRAQALGLFLMSSTSTSTISLTSSWDPRRRGWAVREEFLPLSPGDTPTPWGAPGEASATLPPPYPPPPAPSSASRPGAPRAPSGAPSAAAPGASLPRRRATPPAGPGPDQPGSERASEFHPERKALTSKATRGFQLSFCFALVLSPCRKSCGGRERESTDMQGGGGEGQRERRENLKQIPC